MKDVLEIVINYFSQRRGSSNNPEKEMKRRHHYEKSTMPKFTNYDFLMPGLFLRRNVIGGRLSE
jgi:hypothetical protein